MHILVLCSESQQKEINPENSEHIKVTCMPTLTEEAWNAADVVIDLSADDGHARHWRSGNQLIIINSVVDTVGEIGRPVVRTNGWPGFLQSNLLEASGCLEKRREAENAMRALGKEVAWVPDEPGFMTARVVSMIINEAYFALEEGVSSKAEIDIAMKQGTAYPYGPFEWAEKIGEAQVVRLLARLQREAPHYQPAPLLLKEANI